MTMAAPAQSAAMHRETTPFDIGYVVTHMRDDDVREHDAVAFSAVRDDLRADLVAAWRSAIKSFTFFDRRARPATILSAYLISPGVARLHRISTDAWPEVSLAVFRFGLRVFLPVLDAVVHRCECAVLADHHLARRILQRLGFEEEGIARARGRNGENFVNFARVRRACVPG
ncbi:hypothetical protein ACWX0K_10935 [Nitrobacteraceae bacterium UC4446_H13]